MIRCKKSIGLIAPVPPPIGGMAIQAIKLAENLRKEGFRVIVFPTNPVFPRSLRWLDKLKFVRTLVRSLILLRKINRESDSVDVFYFLTGFVNFFLWVTLPVLFLLKLKGKKVILSARGGDAGRFFSKWKWIAMPALKVPQTVTVPSGFLQKDFRDHLKMETVIVPNIVDLERFHFRKRSVFRPRFIVTRHLEKMYNIPCVISAFKKILDSYPEARLTIVGGGPERKSLEGLVHALGLDGHVLFPGSVPHDQLPALYDENDIFLNASDVDNQPGAILEAFASGLPVVTTRAGGIPYMVVHEETGFVVDQNDSQALALFAMRLIESPQTGERIAQNAFDYVKYFSWKSIRNILIPLIESDVRL